MYSYRAKSTRLPPGSSFLRLGGILLLSLLLIGCAREEGLPQGDQQPAPQVEVATKLIPEEVGSREEKAKPSAEAKDEERPREEEGRLGSKEEERGGEQPLNIAILAPLSGEYRQLGRNIADAAQLALFNLDRRKRIQLSLIDTGTRIDEFERVLPQLEEKKFAAIIGPLFPDQALFLESYTASWNLPILSFIKDRAALLERRNLYSLALLPEQQLTALKEHDEKLGVRDLVNHALLPDNEQGKELQQGFAILSPSQYHYYSVAGTKRSVEDLNRILRSIGEEPRGPSEEGELARMPSPARENPILPSSLPRSPLVATSTSLGQIRLILGENGWRLRKLIAQSTLLPNLGSPQFLVLSLSDPRNLGFPSTMQENQGRGNLLLATTAVQEGQEFHRTFLSSYGYQPLNIAFWAYDAVAALVDGSYDQREQLWHFASLTGKNFIGATGSHLSIVQPGICQREIRIIAASTKS